MQAARLDHGLGKRGDLAGSRGSASSSALGSPPRCLRFAAHRLGGFLAVALLLSTPCRPGPSVVAAAGTRLLEPESVAEESRGWQLGLLQGPRRVNIHSASPEPGTSASQVGPTEKRFARAVQVRKRTPWAGSLFPQPGFAARPDFPQGCMFGSGEKLQALKGELIAPSICFMYLAFCVVSCISYRNNRNCVVLGHSRRDDHLPPG